jgi:hypothetical protein
VIRALLAVALAATLLAASLPAIESAAADRTAASVDRDVDRLDRAGQSLLAADDPGARRVVSVSLSADSVTAVGVDAFVVRCEPRCIVRYTLGNGASRIRRLDLPLVTPAGAVRLGSPGEHRLTLRLVDGDGGRVVAVRG